MTRWRQRLPVRAAIVTGAGGLAGAGIAALFSIDPSVPEAGATIGQIAGALALTITGAASGAA